MRRVSERISRLQDGKTRRRMFALVFVLLAVGVTLYTANGMKMPVSALSSARGGDDVLSVQQILDAADEPAEGAVSTDEGLASGEEDPDEAGDEGVAIEEDGSGDSSEVIDPQDEEAIVATSDETKDGDGAPEQTVADSGEKDGVVEPADGQAMSATAEAGDATVSLEAAAGANLPADAELRVEEIEPGTKEYEAYKEKALEAIDAEGSVALARFFDITIVSGGEEVQPDEGVQVSIEVPEAPASDEGAEASVVHFGGAAKKGADVVDATEDAGTTTFEAESFSVYGVVYTVDFHWEVDGKEFEFSLPGGGFVSLEHLVEALGIGATDANVETETGDADTSAGSAEAAEEIEDLEEGSFVYDKATTLSDVEASEATKKFVADVESVEFSSPELVWVGKVNEETTVGGLKETNGLEVEYSADLTDEQIAEINAQTVEAGDWALISLRPFTSEETLTVTMKNGRQFMVRVTDAQKPYKDVRTLEDGTYLIYQSYENSTKFMFLKNNGTSMNIVPANGDALYESDLSDYKWQVTKNSNGTWTIKSTNSNRYINLSGNVNSSDWSSLAYGSVALSGTNGIAIANGNKVLRRNESGFYVANGTGAGLTFYKIDNSSSGGSSGDVGIELTDEERAELEKWKETLERFNTLTDYNKMAQVYNEDNRSYQIDITADSGITDFYKNVDLGLVLDVSNSMKFPSSLKALEDSQGNEQQVWMTAEWLNWARNAYSDYYNREGCFYIISDPALTSTIYKIWQDGNQWKYQDASENPGVKVYDVNNGTVFKEPYRQAYTLYYADDTIKRMEYLQNSVTYAIDALKAIVRPTEHIDDETATVQVAYDFFAGKSSSNGDDYAIRKSQDFVNLRSAESELFTVSPAGNEASGTRQDLALYDTNNDPKLAANEFGWHTGYDRYVILVTDGAPNGASMTDVINAANRLKSEKNVKIIAVGLSTKDVDGGSQMLKSIADDVDGDGIPEFYEAEKAKDLEYIFLRILRSVMAKGLVRGKVTDTIDKGFYPVDAQGNPISAGVYKNGTKVQNAQISDYVSNGKPTTAHQNEVFYTWEQVGDEWKITWYNQEIGWDDDNSSTGNPWTGTVFVKAKEDYLGGNLIETNDGNAQIEPTGIKLVINGTPESNWRSLENMTPIDLPVPRVNVHNLETGQHNTTWTVYKGTSVTPKEQLEALWNAIPIEEVVSASENGQHKRTTGASANVGTAGAGETFTLGSLMSEVAPSFNIDSLINQITTSNASASQEFTYNAYGHESGEITIKVERTVGNQTVDTHSTDTVGTPAEQYKVTFTYKPYTENERMNGKVKDPSDTNHHNGQNSRGEEETGEIKSENTHTINVFQKGIQITKVDKTNPNQTLAGATFALYRVDAAGNADVSAYKLPTGNYTLINDSLTVDSQGKVVINPVIPDIDVAATDKTLYAPNISVGSTDNKSHESVFYLVERTAPSTNGATYTKMPGAIKFTLTLSEDKGNDAAATLYDWTQSAAVSAEEYENGSTVYLISDDADGDIYPYKIKNGRPTDITVIKVDKDSRQSIGGAKFSLQRGSANDDLTELTITSLSGGATITPEDYDYNGTNIKVVTIPEGGIKISGLADDTYTLREVSPPAGYLITGSDKTFKTENGAIKNVDDSAHQNEVADIAFEVENEPGKALPNTGGRGTTMIYAIGAMFTGIAGAGLVLRVRRKAA